MTRPYKRNSTASGRRDLLLAVAIGLLFTATCLAAALLPERESLRRLAIARDEPVML